MSACMVCTIGFSFHETSPNEVTFNICNKVICDNVYASGLCVIMAEDKLLYTELITTYLMLYIAWQQFFKH